jgi:hypothetical protein
MTLILSGTNGLSDVDGSAATPAIRGTDANTGIFFGADIIGFAEGGAEVARFNANAQFVAAAGTALLPVITTTGDVNTGIFFPAADTIAFSEGGVESMRLDSSANLQFNSGYGSVATAYGCRAWVNFNGTGTVAIRASGNVTSITDNGTGDYTLNFATALVDGNYAVSLCTTEYASTNNVIYPTITGTTGSGATLQSTTQLRINTASLGSPATKYDMALICVSVFR